METEAIKAIEQEAPKETTAPQQPQAVDLSKIEAAIAAINQRLDQQEKNKFSSSEIRRRAEENIMKARVEEEVESIKLENEIKGWEKQKTKLEVRNQMWAQVTNQFLNDEIPRSHIRAAMMDNGFNSGLGQMLNLALLRYLAPNNGVPLSDLEAISLTTGENAFNIRNQPRNVIRLHGRLG